MVSGVILDCRFRFNLTGYLLAAVGYFGETYRQ